MENCPWKMMICIGKAACLYFAIRGTCEKRPASARASRPRLTDTAVCFYIEMKRFFRGNWWFFNRKWRFFNRSMMILLLKHDFAGPRPTLVQVLHLKMMEFILQMINFCISNDNDNDGSVQARRRRPSAVVAPTNTANFDWNGFFFNGKTALKKWPFQSKFAMHAIKQAQNQW